MRSFNSFISTGADNAVLQRLDQSVAHPEELAKSMNKAGLVQKEVQVRGKNGQTFTRKQWVKASEDQSNPQPAAKQEDEGGQSKSISFETNGKPIKQVLAGLLQNGASRNDLMSAAKAQGVEWKQCDHEGINWMRASMAIQKHFGGNAQQGAEQPKTDNQPAAEDKATEQSSEQKQDTKGQAETETKDATPAPASGGNGSDGGDGNNGGDDKSNSQQLWDGKSFKFDKADFDSDTLFEVEYHYKDKNGNPVDKNGNPIDKPLKSTSVRFRDFLGEPRLTDGGDLSQKVNMEDGTISEDGLVITSIKKSKSLSETVKSSLSSEQLKSRGGKAMMKLFASKDSRYYDLAGKNGLFSSQSYMNIKGVTSRFVYNSETDEVLRFNINGDDEADDWYDTCFDSMSISEACDLINKELKENKPEDLLTVKRRGRASGSSYSNRVTINKKDAQKWMDKGWSIA